MTEKVKLTQEEKWKDIEGYEGIYQVSNTGKVKSLKRSVKHYTGSTRTVNERLLKHTIVNGYCHVDLSKYGKRERFLVHRLVASAFLKNPNRKPQVNHIDGNKINNNVNNLEWSTANENVLHGYRTGLTKPMTGSKNGHSKLSELEVIEIRNMYSKGRTQKELAEKFKVSTWTIQGIVENRTWNNVKGNKREENFTTNKTNYKWVEKHRNKYRGRFTHKGKRIDCGLHKTAKEAHEEVLKRREQCFAEDRKDLEDNS